MSRYKIVVQVERPEKFINDISSSHATLNEVMKRKAAFLCLQATNLEAPITGWRCYS
jgi:hypothetical protein